MSRALVHDGGPGGAFSFFWASRWGHISGSLHRNGVKLTGERVIQCFGLGALASHVGASRVMVRVASKGDVCRELVRRESRLEGRLTKALILSGGGGRPS